MTAAEINTVVNTAPITGVPSGPPPLDNKPELSRLKRMFDDFRNNMETARTRQQRDIDYYDDYQLDGRQVRELKKRGQPPIVFNYIKPAVNGTIGVAARGKTDPRAYPRNPQDEAASDIASDVLRYVSDKSRFQRVKLECLKDMLVPGVCAAIVEMGDEDDVLINPITWAEYFYDPRSRRSDFKDAAYQGIAKWVYADALCSLYPDLETEISAAVVGGLTGLGGFMDSGFGDKPEMASMWVDKKLRRLMVVEIYHLDKGQWIRSVFCAAGVLESDVSPYLDDKRRPICPIESASAFKDRENQVYGIVRSMIDPQDEINKRRSKMLHLLSTAQIQQVDQNAPPIDSDIARKEAARPDGVIPSGWQKVPMQDVVAGQAAMLENSVAFLQRLAPIPSLVGRADNSASGRAQLVQSQAGMTELALIFEGFTDWEMRIYRQVWMRCCQFWTDPKWIRVTDEQDAAKFIQINEPIMGVVMQQVTDPMSGLTTVTPTPGIVGYNNRIAEMDMDIVVDSVPDTATLAQEQFDTMMKLLSSNPAWAQSVPFGIALELSSIPNKRKIKKQMEEEAAKLAQANAPIQQLQIADATSKIEKAQSETQKNLAAARNSDAKAKLDEVNAVGQAASMTRDLLSPPNTEQPPAG